MSKATLDDLLKEQKKQTKLLKEIHTQVKKNSRELKQNISTETDADELLKQMENNVSKWMDVSLGEKNES